MTATRMEATRVRRRARPLDLGVDRAMSVLRVLASSLLSALGLLVVLFAFLMNFDFMEANDVLWRMTERIHVATEAEQGAVKSRALLFVLGLWAVVVALRVGETLSARKRSAP